jgi:hypothetical protein
MWLRCYRERANLAPEEVFPLRTATVRSRGCPFSDALRDGKLTFLNFPKADAILKCIPHLNAMASEDY